MYGLTKLAYKKIKDGYAKPEAETDSFNLGGLAGRKNVARPTVDEKPMSLQNKEKQMAQNMYNLFATFNKKDTV
jgi:hypothetical protein